MAQFSFNKTVESLPPSGIRKFFDLVLEAEGDVISLGVGEPDFPTPWHIRFRAIQGLEEGFTSYTSNKGLKELREEVVKDTLSRYGVSYNPFDEVLITNGVSEGMDLAFRACLTPGDSILVPDPGYVMYEPLIRLAGAEPIFYDPLDISSIKLGAKKAKSILLNYPGNPIGNSFSLEQLNEIAAICEEENLLVFSDEIYAGLDYLDEHKAFPSIEKMWERTLWFNGLSKTHSMTGFRIGWVCGPAKIVSLLHKIHQYSALCPASISQLASIEALVHGEDEFLKMKNEFLSRRDYCLSRLESLGIPCEVPQGAFYLFVNIESTGLDEVTFCERLLEEQKLAIVPGSAFGKRGKGYVRMTYAENKEKLVQAFERLEKFIISL